MSAVENTEGVTSVEVEATPITEVSAGMTSGNTSIAEVVTSFAPSLPAGPFSVSSPETTGVEVEIKVDGEAEDDGAEFAALPTWECELAYEGLETSDGRYLIPAAITNRDLPLSLMCQTETDEGHMGAVICGKISRIWREDRPEMGEGVIAILGAGEFSDEMMGPQASRLVEEQVLRGVSVDIAATRRALLYSGTHEEVPEEEVSIEAYMNGEYITGIGGEIMGATLVPFPAFAEASMRIVRDSVTASADGPALYQFTGVDSVKLIPVSITAAAAGLAPIAPPKAWFEIPEPEGKFPLTVMDDGRICGHLATWDQCHHGFQNECVLAKPSRTDYSLFHVGCLKSQEGEDISVGRIVVGEGGHASISYGAVDTNKFYDRTAMVGAFVRAIDGKYGIWLSGVVRSDCPAERVRDMLANPPSGDWRRHNGWLELIAALSVPVPGFPVPRYEYSLVASGDEKQEVEIQSLVATGYFELDEPTFSRAEQRRKEMLLSRARAEL